MSDLAANLVPVIIHNLLTRYPYHTSHVWTDDEPPRAPWQEHPTFGNSFDWHSSAHSQWTGVQIVAADPSGRLKEVLLDLQTPAHLSREAAYLRRDPAFERPYGWGWALDLAGRVAECPDAELRAGAESFAELSEVIACHAIRWLGVMPEPVRHGMHSNTAFAMTHLLAGARALGLSRLEHTVCSRALDWFGADAGWPERWERSGNDFLSPGLAEADLMADVLSRDEFARWFDAFLPDLGSDSRICQPASVPNVVDGQIVHLHGLNLSRAGSLARIGAVLDRHDLVEAARHLHQVGMSDVVNGHYLSTHWLATFAWDGAVALGA